MKLLAVVIYISFGVLIPHVSATCDGCKTTWDASGKACSDDDTYISCLLNAASSDAGCDTRHTKMAEAKTHRDGIMPPVACTALTTTCGCQVTYHSTDLTSGACTTATNAIKCLVAATDDGCIGATTTARKDIVAAFNTIVTNTASCELTDTCKCQTAYAMADVAAAENKCTKLKEEMNCLMSANGVACDGSTKKSAVATAQDAFIVDAVANCKTDLTETCKCQIAYAKVDVTAATDKCTGAKDAIKCLVAATDVGCTASTARKDIVAAINTIVTETASCDLTDTCKCETAYAMADVTVAADKCKAAKTATTCLEAIKSAEEKACDGSTLTKTYLNETITPIVTEACSSGTVVLLSVWVAAACVLSGMIQQ
ncbi:uncharacterized protein LOC121381131 isoform X1 [Gigantopelta aegis]|uniref:uncharacterized protein LOC121381131 isoform X1 n=1 Tax=Gigantopelta aegis TaxID=1735272 RepID=UPI001B8879A6|nr:uncharacterized protein LOC121381131 isoform X1 [Gigantopelta aegis]